MTQTVNELFTHALKYNHELLAYSIYWSIKNGICHAQDDESAFKNESINQHEVEEMRGRNELGIRPIKLYSTQRNPGYNLLILAENEQSARGEYLNEYGTLPKSIEDISHEMDSSFWSAETGYKSVWDMKDETLMFPAILFEYEKN